MKSCLTVFIIVLAVPYGFAAQHSVRNRKSVLEFGCKGDGKADDRLCIQNAANSLSSAGGGTLVLPAKRVFLIGSASTPGYLINWPSNVSLDGQGTIKVRDNIGNYRVLLSVQSAKDISFQNVTFDGNAIHNQVVSNPIDINEHMSIYLWMGENVTVRDVKFINGNDVQTLSLNGCNECKVVHNEWANYGIGETFDHDSSGVYLVGDSGVVEGNTFQAAGIGVRTAIEVHRDNMRVIGNVISGYRIGIIISPNETKARNMLITGNSIRDAYYGVSIWATDGEWEGIDISKNQISINRNSYWKPSHDESGIGLYPGNSHSVRKLTIAGNEIRFKPDALPLNAYSGGISLVAPDKAASVSDVVIENNTVDQPLGVGVNWSVAGVSKAVVIRGNTVRNPGSSRYKIFPVYRTGILDISNASVGDCSISNNKIIDDQQSATMQYGIYHYGIAEDNAETGLRIDGNTVSYRTTVTDAQRYFIARKTIPSFHALIPNFDGNTPVIVDALKPDKLPAETVVEDPVHKRVYQGPELRKGR